jgi:hypothetical protein
VKDIADTYLVVNQLLSNGWPAMVNKKHGKNISNVITTAPANAVPKPPSMLPPWNSTNVAKITSGAGSTLPIAIQSMKTR